jgi:hypothetical protein
VQGKNIVIYNREPQASDGRYAMTGTNKASAWTEDVTKKIKLARDKGVSHQFGSLTTSLRIV